MGIFSEEDRPPALEPSEEVFVVSGPADFVDAAAFLLAVLGWVLVSVVVTTSLSDAVSRTRAGLVPA
jgi:hypothetical protein